MKGKVYLVGAGPGEPGLITQKGLASMAQADVVIYDHLIDERLLSAAPREAEKIYAGKAASDHIMEQAKINDLLVNRARHGKTVVRLKGGDPFVLGRGGEEAEVLAENHIPFEIVPGVSSAIAVPAYAGIPVTHRGLASSFAVITGHENPAKSGSSIDWKKLATGTDTLVFLMGVNNLPDIAARLIKYGRPPDTPVAVIRDGARPGQQTVVGSLKDIADKMKKQRLEPPAVIVVGEVVKLREKLRWYDNRPLSGKRILVTRARRQAGAFSRLLRERGAEPVELPAIEIQPPADTAKLDHVIGDLRRFNWIIFTSVNGVEAFFTRLRHLKLDARTLYGLKVGAIGPATAKALAQQGITADYCPAAYTTKGLIEGLKDRPISGERFLLPRADIADNKLAAGLRRLGAAVREIAAYRTVPAASVPGTSAFPASIDVVTFTSASTVSFLLKEPGLKNEVLKSGAKIACIGPQTSKAAKKAGLTVDITAPVHTVPGLVTALEEYFRKRL